MKLNMGYIQCCVLICDSTQIKYCQMSELVLCLFHTTSRDEILKIYRKSTRVKEIESGKTMYVAIDLICTAMSQAHLTSRC